MSPFTFLVFPKTFRTQSWDVGKIAPKRINLLLWEAVDESQEINQVSIVDCGALGWAERSPVTLRPLPPVASAPAWS